MCKYLYLVASRENDFCVNICIQSLLEKMFKYLYLVTSKDVALKIIRPTVLTYAFINTSNQADYYIINCAVILVVGSEENSVRSV